MWNKIPLGQLVTIAGGGTPSRTQLEFWGGEIPWASVKDLGDTTLDRTTESITEEGLRNSTACLVQPGSLIVATRMGLGKAAINTIPVAINQDLKALRCSDQVDNRYLLHFLLSKADYLESMGKGATVKGFKLDTLERLGVPLPPLAEQRQIAAILDKADAIRRKRQAAIGAVEEIMPSVFIQMFEGSKGRDRGTGRLGNYLSFLTSGSRGWAKYYAKAGVPFLRIQNVGANRLLLSDLAYVNPPNDAEATRTSVESGDVLLSITADLGRTAVIPEGFGRAHINQHLALLRVTGIEPLYLSAFLTSRAGRAQIARLNRAGVKAGLNFDDVRSIEFPLPPVEAQRGFRAIWDRTDALRNKVGQAIADASKMFDSISRSVFKREMSWPLQPGKS